MHLFYNCVFEITIGNQVKCDKICLTKTSNVCRNLVAHHFTLPHILQIEIDFELRVLRVENFKRKQSNSASSVA